MADEVDQFRGAIRDFLDGSSDHYDFVRRFNDIRRATDDLYLGAADGPIMEIIGTLNTYQPGDDPPMTQWLRDAVAHQALRLDALGDVNVLRATTPREVEVYLESGDPDVRAWAARRAEAFADETTVVAALRSRLSDPDQRVSRSAVYTLGRLGDVESVEMIGALLNNDLSRSWRHEIWALNRLAELGGDDVAARVTGILERYLADGGAAVAQTTPLLSALRSRFS